jgi:hypothetical protein
MSAECEYCAAARIDPNSGLYMATCRNCLARALSHQPGYAASVAAGKFRADYLNQLKAIAGDEWEALHRQVRAWDRSAA